MHTAAILDQSLHIDASAILGLTLRSSSRGFECQELLSRVAERDSESEGLLQWRRIELFDLRPQMRSTGLLAVFAIVIAVLSEPKPVRAPRRSRRRRRLRRGRAA